MNITVWTTKDCVQCMMTKKQFDKLGIPYEEKLLADHPLTVDLFKAQGFLSAPIVTTDTKTWSGFRLDKIKSLATHLKAQNK
jgi:glutaredoxin-like protein NrdH